MRESTIILTKLVNGKPNIAREDLFEIIDDAVEI